MPPKTPPKIPLTPQQDAARELGARTFASANNPPAEEGGGGSFAWTPPPAPGAPKLPPNIEPISIDAVGAAIEAARVDLAPVMRAVEADVELVDACALHIARLMTLRGGYDLVDGFIKIMAYTAEELAVSRKLGQALMLSTDAKRPATAAPAEPPKDGDKTC